jgi:cbb3-type cytochrome oxidase maturation protein
MDILYLLIPVSVVLVFVIGAVFFWAISAGQFDELDREGKSVVEDRDSESQYK